MLKSLIIYLPLTIVALAIVTRLLVVWAEPRLAFYPIKGHTPPPRSVALPWERVVIVTADGVRLVGWYTPARPNECTVLFFHGNAGNLNDRADLLSGLASEGLGVLAIDYRGYGSSTGTPSENGVYEDAEAAFRYLRDDRNIPGGRIVVFGRSLGGAVATELASRHKVGGLILEGTFISARRMAGRIIPFWPVGWFMTYRFNTVEKIARIRIPKLLLHGTADSVVPHKDSEELFEAAAEPKEFLSIEDAGHMDIYMILGPAYFTKMAQFCRNLSSHPRDSAGSESNPQDTSTENVRPLRGRNR